MPLKYTNQYFGTSSEDVLRCVLSDSYTTEAVLADKGTQDWGWGLSPRGRSSSELRRDDGVYRTASTSPQAINNKPEPPQIDMLGHQDAMQRPGNVTNVTGGHVLSSYRNPSSPRNSGHVRVLSSLPPSSNSFSVQATFHDNLPLLPQHSQHRMIHRNVSTAEQQLPRSDQSPNKDVPVRFMSASSFHKTNNSQWTVRQHLYRGTAGSNSGDDEQFPVMLVNVSAKNALNPQYLARTLTKPLEAAFVLNSERKGKKWTYRYAFVSYPPNSAPQQTEFAAGDQHSKAVSEAKRLFGGSSSASTTSVPLMRATVVERVSLGLYRHMEVLKAQRTPLKFNDITVDYNHLHIISIFRPTPATMQPMLEILDEFRWLYSRTTQASATSRTTS